MSIYDRLIRSFVWQKPSLFLIHMTKAKASHMSTQLYFNNIVERTPLEFEQSSKVCDVRLEKLLIFSDAWSACYLVGFPWHYSFRSQFHCKYLFLIYPISISNSSNCSNEKHILLTSILKYEFKQFFLILLLIKSPAVYPRLNACGL